MQCVPYEPTRGSGVKRGRPPKAAAAAAPSAQEAARPSGEAPAAAPPAQPVAAGNGGDALEAMEDDIAAEELGAAPPQAPMIDDEEPVQVKRDPEDAEAG